jgi:hypothetical protein
MYQFCSRLLISSSLLLSVAVASQPLQAQELDGNAVESEAPAPINSNTAPTSNNAGLQPTTLDAAEIQNRQFQQQQETNFRQQEEALRLRGNGNPGIVERDSADPLHQGLPQ